MKLLSLSIVVSMMCVGAPVLAQAQDADVIDGYRTNDFMRFWPEGEDSPEGYRQKAANTDPSAHMATAEYEAEDGSSFANVRIVGWPIEAPAPIADDDAEIREKSIAGILQNVEDEGWQEPEEFELVTGSENALSCLRTLQTEQAEFTYCVSPVKGRLMEIQHLASVEAHPSDERSEIAESFIKGLFDHIQAAE